MKKPSSSAIATLALSGALLGADAAQAGIVVRFTEVGSSVVMSYDASMFDATALTSVGSPAGCGGSLNTVEFSFFELIGGSTSCGIGFQLDSNGSVNRSGGWTTGNTSTPFSNTTGPGGVLVIAPNGTNLLSMFFGAATDVGHDVYSLSAWSGTVNNASLASLGLTAGQFIEFGFYADSIRFETVGAAAAEIPEPASFALAGIALLGLGLTRRRRA